MIQNAIWLGIEVLTFYCPIFLTVQHLMSGTQPQVITSLKFWAVLTIYSILKAIFRPLIAAELFPFLDLTILSLLNYARFRLAEKIYDITLGPLYSQHKETIEAFARKLEKSFAKNKLTLQTKVSTSAKDKIKGVFQEMIVDILRPAPIKQKEEDKQQ